MQPLKILNNIQKARLLHSLFFGEMPQFMAFLTETTEHILTNRDKVRENWKDQLFGAEMWLTLAEDAKRTIARSQKELERSSPVFAEQLFSGYTSLYTVQQLINYGERSDTDPKFTQAVELLFV